VTGRGAADGSTSYEGYSIGGGRERARRPVRRTPLFEAQHSERYGRQELIADYQRAFDANLIVVIDQIVADAVTYLEELLYDLDTDRPLHVLLASPGGDGEVALRMVRAMHLRCTELTVIVPDQAKSAATLLCLGADRILMGPAGDLGPVDPQLPGDTEWSLVSCKDLVRAVDEAEARVTRAPDAYPLFASLLADVSMVRLEQARSAIDRSESLVREALACAGNRTAADVEALTGRLRGPLIDDPATHSAVISAPAARRHGLPVELADPASDQWRLIWSLWVRYVHLGCFPVGQSSVYEGQRASHVMQPTVETLTAPATPADLYDFAT